jgi:hypothetical protein
MGPVAAASHTITSPFATAPKPRAEDVLRLHEPTAAAPATATPVAAAASGRGGEGGGVRPIVAAGPGVEAVRAEHNAVQPSPPAAVRVGVVPDRVLSGPHFTDADIQHEQEEQRAWRQQKDYKELQELEHDMQEEQQQLQEVEVPASPRAIHGGLGGGGGSLREYEEGRREPSLGPIAGAPSLSSATAAVEREQLPPPAVAHAQGMTTPSDTFAFKVLSEGGGGGVGSPPLTPRAAAAAGAEPTAVGTGGGAEVVVPVPAIFEPMPGSKEPGHRIQGEGLRRLGTATTLVLDRSKTALVALESGRSEIG